MESMLASLYNQLISIQYITSSFLVREINVKNDVLNYSAKSAKQTSSSCQTVQQLFY